MGLREAIEVEGLELRLKFLYVFMHILTHKFTYFKCQSVVGS